MQTEKHYRHHGTVNCYEHSVSVACMSVWLAEYFHCKVDLRSMIRGALMHDYFLYDWRVPDKEHRFHAFTHAKRALRNAERDFSLTAVERDIIARHMFPLNPIPPKYRESILVCLADKICAVYEVFAFEPVKTKREGEPLEIE